MDGSTNFSSLSEAELRRAKVRIDPTLTPIDYENVRTEIARRKAKRRKRLLPITLRVLGGYLLIGGVVTFSTFVVNLGQAYRAPALAALMVILTALALALLAVSAGALLVARKRLGVFLAMPALLLQLVAFSIGKLSYEFVPLYALRLLWSGTSTGFYFFTGPRFNFRYTVAGVPGFAIDLIALYGLIVLIRAFRAGRRAS